MSDTFESHLNQKKKFRQYKVDMSKVKKSQNSNFGAVRLDENQLKTIYQEEKMDNSE
jgi:hypothetical protein